MEDGISASGKSESLCRVCGDKASGKHYGVSSCDGCRGFFKRSIRRNLEYVCKESGRCIVDVTRRNQCQACRFRKCLQVNMKKDAVQHERAPRSISHPLSHYGPMGLNPSRIRGLHSSSLFASLPLHLQTSAPMLDHSAVSSQYLHHTFLYPSIMAGLSKPSLFGGGAGGGGGSTGLTAGASHLLTSAASQQHNPYGMNGNKHLLQQQHHHDGNAAGTLPSVTVQRNQNGLSGNKDDEVSSSEEAATSLGGGDDVLENDRHSTIHTIPQTNLELPLIAEPRGIRPLDISSLTLLPAENVYESAAKLLFLAVKWARTIPSFLQLSYRDQAILLEESWSELFILTAAQWALPVDEAVLVNNAIAPSSRHCALEEDARKLRDVIARLTVLRVDHTEYACLKALVLFKAESRGLCEPNHVELLQDQTHVMLHEYCVQRSPKGRFGKLLLSLPAVLAVSRRGLEELLFKQTVGDVSIDRLLGDMATATHA